MRLANLPTTALILAPAASDGLLPTAGIRPVYGLINYRRSSKY